MNSSSDWMSIHLLRNRDIINGQYLTLRFASKSTLENSSQNFTSYINSTLNSFTRFYKAKCLELEVSSREFNNLDKVGNNIFRVIEEVTGELPRINTNQSTCPAVEKSEFSPVRI